MLKPRMPVRRFDVFAEYNRQIALQKGMAEDEAEGYGLWVAKVVASGGGRGPALKPPSGKGSESAKGKDGEGEAKEEPKEKWRALGGEEQTDEMFHKEIVKRMGEHFYETVFAPAIEDALAQDRTYQSIRDTIRKDWKP
jgi:hypothetical protein